MDARSRRTSNRVAALAPAVATLLTLGAMAAACNGSGGLTLEAYLQRVDELDDARQQQAVALEEPLRELSEAEAVVQLRQILPQEIALFEDFADGLEDLDPPAEAEALHAEALDALQAFSQTFGDLSDEFAGVESFADLDALFSQQDAVDADERLTQVCLDIEQLAADNEITIDLSCQEE